MALSLLGGRRLSAPLDVELALTSRCQLRCTYCSAMPFDGGISPTRRTADLINELGELRVFSLLLSGGEPSLHPAFLELSETANRVIPFLSINTNGLLFADERFASALNAVAPRALLSVSLDSHDAGVSNLARGAGASKAMHAIENLLSVGQDLCISTVLTEHNLDCAHHIVETYAPRVRRFKFFPRVPRSRSEVELNGAIYQEKLEEFFTRIAQTRIQHEGIEVIVPSSEHKSPVRRLPSELVIECTCAWTKLYLNNKLDAYPCYYSAGSENFMGSCLHKTISDVWRSANACEIASRAATHRLCGVDFGKHEVPVRYLQKVPVVGRTD